jgi:hypothetical protein
MFTPAKVAPRASIPWRGPRGVLAAGAWMSISIRSCGEK